MKLTIADIARECRVSTATVSMVLNHRGRVSQVQRERILRKVKELGYRGNRMAKGLVEGRSYRIAIVVEGALNEHAIIGQFSFYHGLGLLSKGFHDQGYAIEIAQMGVDADIEKIEETLLHIGADGHLLLRWLDTSRTAAVLTALRKRRIPAVACGTSLRGTRFSWVDLDREATFRDATRILLADGFRKIALLHCLPNVHFQEAENGFLNAVRNALNHDASPWVFRVRHAGLDPIMKMVSNTLKRLKDVRAFLLNDNFYAEAVLYALREKGLTPGRDCRVIGFGDTELADRCTPRLSHYSIRVEDQVAFCISSLLGQILGKPVSPAHRLLPSRYLARET